MIYTVNLSEAAIADLLDLRNWIAANADPFVAEVYVDRVTAKFGTLSDFPQRSTPRDNLSPGLRSIAFERKLIIFYVIKEREVWIEHIVDGRRDVETLF